MYFVFPIPLAVFAVKQPVTEINLEEQDKEKCIAAANSIITELLTHK
jgi:hypothetical protein